MTPDTIPRELLSQQLAVKTHSLNKRFGQTQALAGLNLTVPEQSFYVLVGTNGAGKSTTMRILLDVLRADAGVAEVFGVDTRRGAAVRTQIGWVPDRHDTLYPWMRAGALMASHARYYPSWDHEYATRLTREFAVDPARKLNRMSKGEVRRVQLILALAHRPRLLLLDEPTDGLDPAARENVLGILAQHISDSEATVLVATHLVYEMERLADHIGVLADGRLKAQVRREDMDMRMRSYSLNVSEDWHDSSHAMQGLVILRKNARQREIQCLIWGEEKDVVEQLAAAGATVRDVKGVTLEDAAIALMTSTTGERE